MRILIVGGGVAGLTLAALLRQRGGKPTVVEAVPAYGRAGYLISLWPMGNRVLRGLGLYGGFREVGVPLERHVLRDGRGRVIRVSEVGARMAPYGEILTLERADLVELLRSYGGGIPVRMGTTVEGIEQDERYARTRFSDGSEDEFDLVVGADGANSRVRGLLLGEVAARPAGAVLYWWSEELKPGAEPATTIDDYWGAGRLLGLYSGKKRSARYAMFAEADAAEACPARHYPPPRCSKRVDKTPPCHAPHPPSEDRRSRCPPRRLRVSAASAVQPVMVPRWPPCRGTGRAAMRRRAGTSEARTRRA